jgi:DNA-binding MarR family transcriptional regulator
MPPRRRADPPAPAPSGKSAARASDALWDDLVDCHRRLRQELQSVVRRHGIHLAEYRALARLVERPLTLSELSESLGVRAAAVTDLARQLGARGWTERRTYPEDRRARLLAVTARGRRARESARKEYRARLHELYEALPPRARGALRIGLSELSGVLRVRSPAGGGANVRVPPEKRAPDPGRTSRPDASTSPRSASVRPMGRAKGPRGTPRPVARPSEAPGSAAPSPRGLKRGRIGPGEASAGEFSAATVAEKSGRLGAV